MIQKIIALFALISGIFLAGFVGGKRKKESQQKKEVIKNANTARKIDDDVDSSTDAELIKRMHRWQRD